MNCPWNSIVRILKYLLKCEYYIAKQDNTLLLARIASRFCIVESPSLEYIIIEISVFYDAGAGLVAVIHVK